MSGLGKTFDSNIKTRLSWATIDTSTDQQLNPTRSGAGIKNWFSDYYSFQDQAASILQLTVPSSAASASSSSSSSTWPSLLYFTSLVEVNQAIKAKWRKKRMRRLKRKRRKMRARSK